MIKIYRKHHIFLENIEYNNESMRRYLFNTYGPKCCYCETSLAYFEVEHFYPKGDSKRNSKNPKKLNALGRPLKLTLYETSKILKRIVRSKKKFDSFSDEQENLHLACKRCNLNKGTFCGYSLSPNFYFDKSEWKEISQEYLDSKIRYIFAEVECHPVYLPFVEKLQLNGNGHIGKALLRRRILYLNETLHLLDLCIDLNNAKQHTFFFELFKIVAYRFNKSAPFASMIINNLGKAFFTLFGYFNDIEKKEIAHIVSQ